MSGVNLPGTRIRKGSVDAIARFLEEQGSSLPQKVRESVEEIARLGGTPLVVAENSSALGVIYLKDVVKGGLKAVSYTHLDVYKRQDSPELRAAWLPSLRFI